MKLESKYFDSIRIKKRGNRAKTSETVDDRPHPVCQWKGCDKPGKFRAPKGRGRDGEFFAFCAEHVRQYNASYNYFDGMSDAQVEEFQKDALTGHRPTWKVAGNSHAEEAEEKPSAASATTAQDFHAWRAKQARRAAKKPSRKLKPLELKAVTTLGLTQSSSKEEIKTRFKELVKTHHPDANGGDRGSEEKLREIIQAYNYLKSVGMV